MLVRNETIYRVYVFLPDSELAALTPPDKYWGNVALNAISNAGWRSALRREYRVKDMEGNEGIEIPFEVGTADEHDRLLTWLKTDPFKPAK